jgi:hypothetical protein
MKKLSARNQLQGKVVEVRKGQTTAQVRIDIGNGVVVTSSITNEASGRPRPCHGRRRYRRHQGVGRDGRKVRLSFVLIAACLAAMVPSLTWSESPQLPCSRAPSNSSSFSTMHF